MKGRFCPFSSTVILAVYGTIVFALSETTSLDFFLFADCSAAFNIGPFFILSTTVIGGGEELVFPLCWINITSSSFFWVQKPTVKSSFHE